MPAPIYPRSLKKGSKIGIFAPSSYVDEKDIKKSTSILEEHGFEVFIHPQTFERVHQSAGTHLQKCLAFQGLWQRDDIDAIWAAGGGNRALHLIDMINFKKIASKPKMLIGFSDVTALLNAVYAHTSIVSIHGPVFKNFHKFKEKKELIGLLQGNKIKLSFKEEDILHSGKGTGQLIGGNLSIFQYLPQTLPNEFYEGGILFLEDCNEELSKIDRMFLHLKRLGVLNKIKGFLVGQFTDIPESGTPFGFTLIDLIEEHTEGLDIPIITNLPFGHGDTLYPLAVGAKVNIDTNKKSFQFCATRAC